MKRSELRHSRLFALGLLALPLMTYPILSLVEGNWAGLPAAFLYLFVVWAGVIGLAAWLAEGRSH